MWNLLILIIYYLNGGDDLYSFLIGVAYYRKNFFLPYYHLDYKRNNIEKQTPQKNIGQDLPSLLIFIVKQEENPKLI
jgi:hypothetical protein